MNNNSSLKEYYINIQNLYQNAVNMLTALNQSLSTSSSEVTVSIVNDNNVTSQVRIPSMLYLENKLEQLDSNFNTLFNIPKTGEAWFQQTENSNMYKLNLVKTSSAPQVPQFSTTSLYAGTTINNILKDMVNPRTYIRLNIDNLTDNIEQVFMRKIVIKNTVIYDSLTKLNLNSYAEYKAALFNYVQGVDYEEYDSVLNTPIKTEQYNSEFKIIDLPALDSGNPWTDVDSTRLQYKLKLNTIEYTDKDDTSIVFKLKTGDFITLDDNYAIYRVKNVSSSYNNDSANTDYYIIIEEYVGHTALMTTSLNSSMIFKVYNPNYSEFHYVDIPLEENPYICVFLGTITNGVRSQLSTPILLNLNNILMKDESGNYIYGSNSKSPLSYIQYYDKYCNNIGDLIDALSETSYPQISNYDNDVLNELSNSVAIQNYVGNTISADNSLTVKKINSHLTDTLTSDNITQLHAQKAELNSQLSSLQDNIDQVYSQLTTTDFSQNTTLTQESLKSQLNTYYSERITLQKQVIAVINQIDALKTNVVDNDKSKFRVRGTTNVDNFISFLQQNYGNKLNIIGADIQYKYSAVNNTNTTLTSINSTVFTDWNKYITSDKQRYLKFDDTTNSYEINYVDYGNDVNIIKWNQIDIPIQKGEDVIIKVRYKYNIGQPFIELYTPWSNEITIAFPTELEEDTTITDIISKNNDDVIGAKFNQTLINDGYEEHINNKIIDNSQTFFHMPENIYSGYTTPENKMISLRDELQTITSQLDEYRSLMHNELNSKFKVFLEYDNNVIELIKSSQNNITINETANGVNNTFIKKNMNIVFKNVGDTTIKFYSIFPGDVTIPLLQDTEEFSQQYLINYDRVPLLFGKSKVPTENVCLQKMGQWVYFRSNNPYSSRSIYYNSAAQNQADIATFQTYANGDNTITHFNPIHYSLNDIGKDFNQPTVGYVLRNSLYNILWNQLSITQTNNNSTTEIVNSTYDYTNVNPSMFIYDDKQQNKYILKYEHLVGKENGKDFYMSTNMSFDTFKTKATSLESNSDGLFVGAFLIPELITDNALVCPQKDDAQYLELASGESISIPVIFEYYMNGAENTATEITKGLYFDLRPSLFKDPTHYMINVTAKYDYTVNNSDIVNMANPLIDTVTE